jgi:hypothetical protein
MEGNQMAAKKKAKKEVLVVGSKVKAYIKSKKMMCSGDLIEGLSSKVYDCIDDAVTRTKNNKRSTVRPHDL